MIKKSKLIIITLILMLSMLTLCGCENKDENTKLKEKVAQEIEYLDNAIIQMLNNLNKISYESYDVQTKQVNLEEGSNSEGQSQQSGSQGGEAQGGQENDSQTGNSTITASEMKPNNILVTDRQQIDWTTIKSDIETTYASWNTIILDLYKLNINSDNILGFSKQMDVATSSIKEENKNKALADLATLYSYLPKYTNDFLDDQGKKDLYNSKSNVLFAYSLVEQENWEEVSNYLSQAEKDFTNVLNNINYIDNREYKVNQIYIELKELQNSITTRDKDIFYIKYRNLIQDMDSL